MYAGQYVFTQVMGHVPWHVFRRCVARYDGDRKIKHFSCHDQFHCFAFAQLTWRESLRDIEACLKAQSSKLYHLGFRSPRIARNTMSNANSVRDWRIYADFAQHLIGIARELCADDNLLDLEGLDTVYALDSSTVDLCLSVFTWAPFRSTKAAIKLHTLLDLRGNIPSFIFISDGKMHDVRILDHLVPEPGAFYVMDRGYIDFTRLARLDDAGSFFVTRAKSNIKAKRRYSRPVDRSTGLICDQTTVLPRFYTRQGFDRPLRRVKFNDPETGKTLVFLTNNFALPAMTIAKLYKYAWQVELFFKWIKHVGRPCHRRGRGGRRGQRSGSRRYTQSIAPDLLNLVKKGILPCRIVGAHHRIPTGALIAYKREQAPRRRSIEALSAETQDLGH